MPKPNKSRFLSRLAQSALIVFFLAVIYSPAWFLTFIGEILVANDDLRGGADAVWVLMGEPTVRVPAAVKLVLSDQAPKLVFVRPQTSVLNDAGYCLSEGEISTRLARIEGLKDEQMQEIKGESRATSTVDEAILLKNYLAANSPPIKKLIVVTSWYHSRRAKWIISKVFADTPVVIEVRPSFDITYQPRDWWKSEEGLVSVFVEYVKFGRYLALYAFRGV